MSYINYVVYFKILSGTCKQGGLLITGDIDKKKPLHTDVRAFGYF